MHIKQETIIQIDTVRILQAVLSLPGWDLLSDHASEAARGFVRHGRSTKAKDWVPKDCKKPYQEHLMEFLSVVGESSGTVARAMLAFGVRNTFQNLWLPAYDSSRSQKILCRIDEPLGSTVYHAFCVLRSPNGPRFAIAKIRLHRSGTSSRIEFVDANSPAPEDVLFAFVGQPILFEGEVTPHELVAAVTYDFRHAWHIEWEGWQNNPAHRRVHARLMRVMMSMLTRPTAERAAALARIAIDAGLAVEDRYLHSSISLSPNGKTLNLVMMHGSFDEVARAHRALGSREALLLDNGGSVGAAVWRRQAWLEALSSGRQTPPLPTYVGNNTYFRPRGHAIVFLDLNEDIVEGPFLARSRGDVAWESASGTVPSDRPQNRVRNQKQ